jgi:O-antigen/teichoic acid export membrane protein
VVARIVTGFAALALVPLLIHRLGFAPFGWLSALLGFAGLAQFADLGLTLALQARMSAAAGRGDEREVERLYRTGVQQLRRLGLGWSALVVPLAIFVGPRVLPTPAEISAADAWVTWGVIGLAIGAGVATSAGARLAAATQESWILALWTSLASLGVLGFVWLLPDAATHVEFLAAVICAGQIVPGAVVGVHLARRRRWAGTAPDREVGRELWREGLQFATSHLAGGALTASAPFLVARFGGYEASATFAALQRLGNLATQSHALLLTPFVAAGAEAVAHGDRLWLRRASGVAAAITAAAIAGLALLVFLWPVVGPRWLGTSAGALSADALAWGTAGWAAATLVLQAMSLLLLGIGRLAPLAPAVAVGHTVTLLLAVLAGTFAGGAGVALALALGTFAGPVVVLVRGSAAAWDVHAAKESTPV